MSTNFCRIALGVRRKTRIQEEWRSLEEVMRQQGRGSEKIEKAGNERGFM